MHNLELARPSDSDKSIFEKLITRFLAQVLALDLAVCQDASNSHLATDTAVMMLHLILTGASYHSGRVTRANDIAGRREMTVCLVRHNLQIALSAQHLMQVGVVAESRVGLSSPYHLILCDLLGRLLLGVLWMVQWLHAAHDFRVQRYSSGAN